MDSVQLHLILNSLPTTGVLIAAAIVGLGQVQGGPYTGASPSSHAAARPNLYPIPDLSHARGPVVT
jgi:hypothetical protein